MRAAAYVLLIAAVVIPRLLYAEAARKAGNLNSQFSAELVTAAKSIVEHGTIGNIYPGVEGPSAHVVPLYAYLLAGIFAVAGFATPLASWLMSNLAITFTAGWVALLPGLARRLCGSSGPGWLAAFGYALYPGFFYQDSAGDWEHTLATLLALGMLTLALDASGEFSLRRAAVIGLLLGLTALTNPSLAVAVGFPIIVSSIPIAKQFGIRKAAVFLILTSVVSALIVSPWIIRNAAVFGRFIPIRSNAGLELAVGNHDGADGRTPAVTANDVKAGTVPDHPYVKPADAQHLRQVGETAYMAEKRKQATDWITAHPDRFAELTATRARLFWFPPRDFWDRTAALGWPSTILYSLSTLLAFVGLIVVARRSRIAFASAALFLIAASAPYSITHVCLRYRYPVGGLVFILASIGVCFLIGSMARWIRNRL